MKVNQFLDTVTSHIQSKEAKTYITTELTQHLLKSKNLWIQKGYSELEAEEKAVREMGSPITLGKSLNKLHKPKVDWILISLLCLIMSLSFLPILALNQVNYPINVQSLVVNKVFYSLIGLLIAIGVMFIDYRKFMNFGYLFYGAGAILLGSISLFSNVFINGEAMINFGPITIQIWMAIPFFLIAWAALFSKSTFKLWKGIILFGYSIFLFLLIANLSMLFIYIILVGVLFLCSSYTRKEKLLILGLVSGLGAGVVIFTVGSYMKGTISPYQLERLFGYLNPEKYSDTAGYLYIVLERAIENSSLFGTKALIYLPGAHTDLVFVNLIQTYGYVVGLIIFIVLSVIVFRFSKIALSIKEPFGKLLIFGGVALFSTQFLYSVGMTFGLLPIVSMSLPFISYGFMPIVLNAFIVGITLSVYRRKPFIMLKEINH